MVTSAHLLMFRPNLDALPPVMLPDGYSIRRFQPTNPGEAARVAEIYIEAFGDSYGKWDEARVLYYSSDPGVVIFYVVEHLGNIVALSSGRSFLDPNRVPNEALAWLMPRYPSAGYVAWVAVCKEHQGKRLGRQMTLAVLHFFAAETDKTSATLFTDCKRLAAIKTYFNLGFHEVIIEPSQHDKWLEIKHELFGADATCDN